MRLFLITILFSGLLPAATAARDNREPGEWAMQLWAMTATHHRWPTPSPEPLSVTPPAAKAPQQELQADEHDSLKAAMENTARCVTGRLIYDSTLKLYVPEFQADCDAR